MRLQNSTRPFQQRGLAVHSGDSELQLPEAYVDGRFTAGANRTKESNGIPPEMKLIQLPQVHGSVT